MGNTLYGFGYKYRGRGFIQLTGFNNYASFERDTGLPVTAKPDLWVEMVNRIAQAS